MPLIRTQIALCIGTFCGYSALIAPAQTQLTLVNEIKLPVHPYKGTFGGGHWATGSSSDEIFQFMAAADQSLLVLYPVTNGKWELIRLRNWWTATSETEELDLPGWTEANTLNEAFFSSDLLITPDGHYAIAMGGVASVKDARNIPFPPNGSIEHKPDLQITVIDLKRWQIVGALHTATVDPEAEFRGATIVNGRWLALQGMDKEPESVKYEHLFDRVNRLISIPDLKSGPGCDTKDPEVLILGHPPGGASGLSQRNDSACKELLTAAGFPSMRILDWRIFLGHDPEPIDLRFHTDPWQMENLREDDTVQNIQKLTWPDGEYYPGYWTSNEWDIYFENPPFESSAGIWYQLRKAKGKGPYQLSEYSIEGRLLKTREANFNSNPRCGSRFGCVCDVVDASEQQGAILALCRNQSVNFAGSFDWHKQWIAIFHDDLSLAGEAQLTTKLTRVAIASAEGRTYVAAVEQGKVVRVYSVPAP